MILNWTNSLRKTDDGTRYVAAQVASAHKADGFSATESLSLMVADNYDIDIAKEVLAEVYDEKSASVASPAPTRFAMVVPTSYQDVVPLIDDSLTKLSPNQFVDSLFKHLISSSRRDRNGWVRLAQQAVNDPAAKKILHEDLKPWVEETMLNSVVISENEQFKVKTADVAEKRYVVSTNNGDVDVDLQEGICSCDKFQNGCFSSFGLACEHMVKAAEVVSPFERLTRALKNS
jgi:hypothetical protein